MRKTFFLGVGRWLTAAVIGFFLLRMLFSGGSADVPFETVTNAVVQTVDLSETKTADAQMVRRLYGLDPADYAGCVLYYPAQSMGVTELTSCGCRIKARSTRSRRPCRPVFPGRKRSLPVTRRSSMRSARTAAP